MRSISLKIDRNTLGYEMKKAIIRNKQHAAYSHNVKQAKKYLRYHDNYPGNCPLDFDEWLNTDESYPNNLLVR